MVLFALSFQGQVEKYGAYVGIAAFFGLAVMSLLYFSQARELKRIREWAERAPERAGELERRVVAQATASVARRVPSMPGAPVKAGIAPPRRLAEMPAPAAVPQATELVEAVEADPATNGNVPKPPFGPGGTVPAGGLPVSAATAVDGGAPSANGAVAAPDEAEAPDEAAPAGGEAAVADQAAAPDEAAVAPGGEAAAADQAAAPDGAALPAEAPVARADQAPPGATEPAGFPALDDGSGAAAPPVPGEIPAAAAVPRATPAQRVGVKPQPLPLRQTQPTATPSGGGRRPGAPVGRRPVAKPPREGRSAGTIALFVGLAVLILGGGAFLGSQLLGGDDESTPPNRAAAPPTESAEASGDGGGGGAAAQAPPVAETNVGVLNGTTFPGLAGQLADQMAAEGYERGITETNIRDQTIQESTIYYADGFRPSARAIGRLFSIEQLEPLDSETASLAPGADVVVLAGADQTP